MRGGEIEVVALIAVFAGTPEAPDFLLRSQILVETNAIYGLCNAVRGAVRNSWSLPVRFGSGIVAVHSSRPCSSTYWDLIVGEGDVIAVLVFSARIEYLAKEHRNAAAGAGIPVTPGICPPRKLEKSK